MRSRDVSRGGWSETGSGGLGCTQRVTLDHTLFTHVTALENNKVDLGDRQVRLYVLWHQCCVARLGSLRSPRRPRANEVMSEDVPSRSREVLRGSVRAGTKQASERRVGRTLRCLRQSGCWEVGGGRGGSGRGCARRRGLQITTTRLQPHLREKRRAANAHLLSHPLAFNPPTFYLLLK